MITVDPKYFVQYLVDTNNVLKVKLLKLPFGGISTKANLYPVDTKGNSDIKHTSDVNKTIPNQNNSYFVNSLNIIN